MGIIEGDACPGISPFKGPVGETETGGRGIRNGNSRFAFE